ncbi:phosphate ABC transporter substrate-binding protein, PhoT family [Pseudoflavitalea sp. G-6-1-2]|uniref:PstS family phosphate ABC transporter substrate-binding protein n=1 Tax=Pseudoflavitalea sp. G-6-1-2 TaxID=2728841 RepID=UPI00146DD2EC|nr:substrate-binding domain-containing protein [Pseudoflavitalea sp. G-6-1-2]NML19295.1 phosphate ABC transporter substrate-binding protein, PhoT family [Pseudoflavitalea sp. G-6-1-2]
MKSRFFRYLNRKWLVVLSPALLLFSSCSSNKNPNGPTDTTTSGTIHISVDESFKPVIDSQIQVFESQRPDAKIIVHYKPEAECLRDLNVDSIRMVIVTRGLTENESKTLTEKLSFKPGWGLLAYDAIAVLVNSKSKDTTFTMQDIRGMVKGNSGYKYKVLLDGTTSTSTVRYVTDSLLAGQPMSKNVVAANSSEGVIDYVAKNNDAIGLVGVSWVGNREDTTQLSFLKKVKIADIECTGCNGTYVAPVQYNIATARYPMYRPIWYILKENYDGLGNGFTNFLINPDKGQRIFSRAYLLPARMRFDVRTTKLE